MACSGTNVRLLDLSQHQFQPRHPGSNMILNHILVSGVKAYRFVHVSVLIIFGPKWNEVTREWRKLRNEELNTYATNVRYIYIYGAPSRARNANVVYIWTYVWQR